MKRRFTVRSIAVGLFVMALFILVDHDSSVFVQASTERMEIHSKHWLYGYPYSTDSSTSTNDLIIRDVYALSSNDTTKFADWVAYKLTPHETFGTLDLERDWRTDPWLEEDETLEAGEGSTEDDYLGAYKSDRTGFDRGHMAPLGSFKGTRFASQVNFYSNITPQISKLNQGPWRALEDKVRVLVQRHFEVWVMTGPLYDGDAVLPTFPGADEPVTIPTGFWKIIVIEEDDIVRAGAFIMEQDDTDTNLSAYITTIDTIETRAHIDFFWMLEDTVEGDLEDSDDGDWVVEAI